MHLVGYFYEISELSFATEELNRCLRCHLLNIVLRIYFYRITLCERIRFNDTVLKDVIYYIVFQNVLSNTRESYLIYTPICPILSERMFRYKGLQMQFLTLSHITDVR